MDKVKATAEAESLLEMEEAKITNVAKGMKVVDSTIFEFNQQAKMKPQHIASIKVEVERWTTNLAKAQRDKESIDRKWKELKEKL